MIKLRLISPKNIILIALIASMILLIACDVGSCTDSGFFEDFRDVTGVDLNKPADVAKIAASGETVGNEDQNDAIETASRNVAQMVYTKFGDDHEAKAQWDLAAVDYQQAIYQTRMDTDGGKLKVQELHAKMAEDYAREGGSYRILIDEGTPIRTVYECYKNAAKFYAQAAAEYRKAADIAQDRMELSTAEKYLSLANKAAAITEEMKRLADLNNPL